MLSLSDIYALGIATGYVFVIVGIWRVRGAFVGISSFGALLYPLLGCWIVFYASLPFINEVIHRNLYVWLSRGAHTLGIVLMVLLVRLGENIIHAIQEARNHAR